MQIIKKTTVMEHFLYAFDYCIHMPQCLLTMHYDHYMYGSLYTHRDNSIGTKRTNDSSPPPPKKEIFSIHNCI